MINQSHRTAIARKALSGPARYLREAGLLRGRLLDWGCGRGFDCDELGAVGFDPHYRPELPVGQFDSAYCVYVLNVIPDQAERDRVQDSVVERLKPGGVAYFAVRADSASLRGWTSKGTWQGEVVPRGECIKATSAFRIYRVVRS
jgi:hypothetical protein